jgi:multidrug efflux pump subunit AcrB
MRIIETNMPTITIQSMSILKSNATNDNATITAIITPREEEPQIIVPMIDVYVTYPGASAKEVEERVTKPMEKFLWEIEGVEYIYSMSSPRRSTASHSRWFQ